MRHHITCIKCPVGCQLVVETEGELVVSVSGNKCPKGDAYGRKELTAPERTVTTTVKLTGGILGLVPVKTDKAVPRELTFKVIEEASRLILKTPVNSGQIVIKGVAGTDANLVVTRSMAND